MNYFGEEMVAQREKGKENTRGLSREEIVAQRQKRKREYKGFVAVKK